jgi:hypothetical protein
VRWWASRWVRSMTCARRAVDISTARICGQLRVEHRAYAQLVADHVRERGAAQSAIETEDAALAARIAVQIPAVADLDRRLGQIDSAIEEAARRGETNTALSAIEEQSPYGARGRAWPPCR